MKSEYVLIADLFSLVRRGFNFQQTSTEINKSFDVWKANNCYTKSGKPRYRKGFIQTLHAVFIEYKTVESYKHIVFGYWYQGTFYCTYKNNHESVVKHCLETTNVLHDMKLPLSVWDNMESGYYYPNTLKKYF